MTPAELEKLVNEDNSVKVASVAVSASKSKLDSSISLRDIAYGYWQEKEADVSKNKSTTPPGLANQRKLLRDKAKADYFLKRDNVLTAQVEYDSDVSIYNKVKEAANGRIVLQAGVVQQSQVADSQTKTTANIAEAEKTKLNAIAEKLKANKKYIVWGLIGVVLVVVAIVVIKKFAK